MASDSRSYGKRLSSLRWGLFFSFLLFLVFGVFTWTVTWFDVRGIGINGKDVGYSTINGMIHSMFPGDHGCYEATEILGYFCVMMAGVNALIAIADLVKSRGFKGMHKRNLITMFFYSAVVIFYIVFSFVSVNCRPNSYEQSYPSSHTMLGICVLYSEITLLRYGAKRNRDWIVIFDIFLYVCMAVMIVFRLLSGVHWLTDIIGGMLLSFALTLLYRTMIMYFDCPSA